MPYVKLKLNSGDDRVDVLIRHTIEPYLEEAHWLLAATRPADGPGGHFARACAVMLLATVAATSALPIYERDCKRRKTDKDDFISCVRKYFPWECIGVADDKFRSGQEKIEAASVSLYCIFRCPLLHSAGLVGGLDTAPVVITIHPGSSNISAAELRIEEIANAPTLEGQCIIKLGFKRHTLYVDWFYWCVRTMVERFAADPTNTNRILEHSFRRASGAADQEPRSTFPKARRNP